MRTRGQRWRSTCWIAIFAGVACSVLTFFAEQWLADSLVGPDDPINGALLRMVFGLVGGGLSAVAGFGAGYWWWHRSDG